MHEPFCSQTRRRDVHIDKDSCPRKTKMLLTAKTTGWKGMSKTGMPKQEIKKRARDTWGFRDWRVKMVGLFQSTYFNRKL